MAGPGDYTDCKAVIRDVKTGNTIAETIVLEYDKQTLTLTVDSNCFRSEEPSKVSVLLFHNGSILEYKGIVRKQSIYGQREISLYQGQEKEDRTAVRHPIHLRARVESLLVSDKKMPFKKPLDVTLLNLSTHGILMLTNSSLFQVDTHFQLILNIAGSDTVINTCVVRMARTEGDAFECGCKFLAVSE